MRTNYFRPGTSGQKFFDKVTGKFFAATLVEEGKITAAEIDRKDQIVEDGEQIVVTDDNAICYRFVSDPNEKPVPQGYRAEDGFLVKPDGDAVATGFSISGILAALKGKILVLCENSSLRLYDVIKDKFSDAVDAIKDPEVVLSSEDDVLLEANDYSTEEIEEDGSKKKLINFTETVLYRFSKNGFAGSCSIPYVLQNDGSKSAFRLVSEGLQKIACIPVNFAVQDNAIETLDKSILLFLGSMGYEEIDGTYAEGGVTDYGTVLLGNKVYIRANGDNYLNVPGKQLSGYVYLVDVTVDGNVTTFTLTNSEKNVKTIVTERTEDRGVISKIQ